jgi:phosphoadenosine phosphosulfate reductase
MEVTHTRKLIADEIASAARPCMTMSFQAECVAIAHMARAVAPNLPVLFLDTWHHFPETFAYAQRLARDWRLNLVTLRAGEPHVGLWRTDTDACCARHKVAPLFGELAKYDTWLTGLRRGQSPSRAALDLVERFTLPGGHALRKVSPLAFWTAGEVDDYLATHGIPRLPLYDAGYTSIGCAPCTSRPADAASPRSGRWGGRKLECGIHIGARDDRVTE